MEPLAPLNFLKFYAQAYKLKLTLRHCWLGIEHRKESVADHTWGLTLFACLIVPQLKIEIDLLKLLKMLIYHDLAEAVTGDIPATLKQSMLAEEVHNAEKKALQELVVTLPSEYQSEIIALWEEFEDAKTDIALVANAIDKAEAIIQHDLSDIDTWEEAEYTMNVNYKDHFFDADPYLRSLKDFINHYNYWLTERAGKLDLLVDAQKDYWQQNKGQYSFDFVDYK